MGQAMRHIVLQPITFAHNTGETIPVITHQNGVVSGEPFITIDMSELQPDNDPYGCLVTSEEFPIYIDAPYGDSKYNNHPLISWADIVIGNDFINFFDYDMAMRGMAFCNHIPVSIYKYGQQIYRGLANVDDGFLHPLDEDIDNKYSFELNTDIVDIAITGASKTKKSDERPIMVLDKHPWFPLLGDSTWHEYLSDEYLGSLPLSSIVTITRNVDGVKVYKIIYNVFNDFNDNNGDIK